MGFFDEMRSAGEVAAQAGQQHLTEQKIAQEEDKAYKQREEELGTSIKQIDIDRQTEAMWQQKEDTENTKERELTKQTKVEIKTYNREQRQREREEAKTQRLREREARRTKRQEAITTFKRNIVDGIQNTKKLGSQIGNGLRTARDIFVGITQTEAGKEAIKSAIQSGVAEGLGKIAEAKGEAQTWMGDRRDDLADFILDKKGDLVREFKDLKDSAIRRKDQLTSDAKTKVEDIRKAFKEQVISPVVEQSKAIGNSAVDGVKKAGLFTYGLALKGAEISINTVNFVTGKTKEGAAFVKKTAVEQFNQAVENANEWKNKLVGLTTEQAQTFSRNLVADYNEIQAAVADIKAAPSEIIAKLTSRLAEHLAGVSEKNRISAEARRGKAISCRTTAESLRPTQLENQA